MKHVSGYFSPFGSMAERVRGTDQAAGPPGPVRGAAAESDDPGRHVLVLVDGRWRPGVLERWERRSDAWWGLVGYVLPATGLIAEWARQERLRPPG